jgi:methyl-accepting chemotaxis protein
MLQTVVQTNSATSEECAASSEELSGQANMLMEAVKKIKLKNVSSEISADVTESPRRIKNYNKVSPSAKDADKPKISLTGNYGKP